MTNRFIIQTRNLRRLRKLINHPTFCTGNFGEFRSMSELREYGKLGESIEKALESVVVQKLQERTEPAAVLVQFGNVDNLTIDEMSVVLRGATKEKIQDACNRGELPHIRFGRDYLFPKKLVSDFLLGIWKPEEKAKAQPNTSKSYKERVNNFVN